MNIEDIEDFAEVLIAALKTEGGEDAYIEPSFGGTLIIDGRFNIVRVARYILDRQK